MSSDFETEEEQQKMKATKYSQMATLIQAFGLIAVLVFSFWGCGDSDEITKGSIWDPPPVTPVVTTGTINGQLTGRGVNPSGATVILVTIGEQLAATDTADNGGKYLIENITPGQYYLIAYLDYNGNGEFDSSSDPFGAVVNSNGLAIINVSAGSIQKYDFTIGYYYSAHLSQLLSTINAVE
jgi:hypothetical protein